MRRSTPGTPAGLLPRLLKDRTEGLVFLTHRRPGPGKVLSQHRVRALLDAHTALGGPGTGWDLDELRHSALTHLGENRVSLLMLMAEFTADRRAWVSVRFGGGVPGRAPAGRRRERSR
ncbi:hypothetical protein ACWEPL_57825 [Nonomuraea sp. NPDC004186]